MNPHQLNFYATHHTTQEDATMAPPTRQKRTSKTSSNGTKRRQQRRREYEETPDYGTAFQREDNEPPRPRYTGQGVLSAETLKAIRDADGEFQISIWTHDADGEPLRNRDGTRRLRLHIEEPYEQDADDDDRDDDQDDRNDDDDIPF